MKKYIMGINRRESYLITGLEKNKRVIDLAYPCINGAESIEESSVAGAFQSYGTILRHVCRIASNAVVKAAATWHASIVGISWATKNEKSSLVFSSLAVWNPFGLWPLMLREYHLDRRREREKERFFGKFILTAWYLFSFLIKIFYLYNLCHLN